MAEPDQPVLPYTDPHRNNTPWSTEPMSRPSLFHFASSELSQDAFICWLLSWADPELEGHNSELHATAHDLILSLLAKHEYEYESQLESIDIKQQHSGIDIVAVLNEEMVLLIEDKVHTAAHSGQLSRYRAVLSNDFDDSQVFPIYFKTGDQSSFKRARKNGYEPFVREDFLEVLEAGLKRGVSNNIFRDYHAHLSSIDEKVKSFEAIPVAEWPQAAWRGFFQFVQEHLGTGNWKYVSNPSGGFMGYWWHSFATSDCRAYLQLEEEKLCFKIAVEEKGKYKHLRQEWHDKITEVSTEIPLQVTKPDRFGYGRCMTVAVFPGDYRVTDENEIIDLKASLKRLKQAEEVLTRAVQQ